MSRTETMLLRSLPRPFLIIGVPIVGIWLTLTFIVLGFPYNVLADNLCARLEQSLNVALDIGDVAVKFGPAGPGFSFKDVSARFPDGTTYDVNRLEIRPAWSFSWLRGSPSLALDVETPVGSADGTLEVGSPKRWDGEIRALDLSRLPLSTPGGDTGLDVSGTLNATADVRYGEGVLEGEVDFQAEDGVLAHSAMPMGLPYKTFSGRLQLGTQESMAIFEDFVVDSPMMNATLAGTVGQAELRPNAPLDLQIKLSDADPSLLELFKGSGAKITGKGSAELTISGTWGKPSFR